MRYRSRPRRHYSPVERWRARAFKAKPRTKRYVVQYEAIVDGQSVTDMLYVLGSSEKEALMKARNFVKSLHPKAKGIAVAIREEHSIPWPPKKPK
ncbi:MAG: hypothetical protein QXK12_08995 [Candidatus Nezhaarchaeales archaeon]